MGSYRLSLAVLFAMTLALSSCSKPLPPVGKDHILNYFPIAGGKVMKYKCYGKPWDRPWDENQIAETYETQDAAFENGEYTGHRIYEIYAAGGVLMRTTFQVEISSSEITQQVVASQFEGQPAREDKGPLDAILKSPPVNGEKTWLGQETKIAYSAYYGKTKTTLGTYDDCLVVEGRWNVFKSPGQLDKHHIINYYQRGIGLVKHESFNPDGSLNVSGSYELANP
ncbi:MAG TPA: hypothetical protein VJ873_01165 [bacterium]|nr:hypothetical protein [bacterium]